MRTYEVKLRIITPVVIHTGEAYGPLDIIPLNEKEIGIVNVDQAFLLMSADEKNKFLNITSQFEGNPAADIENIRRSRDIIKSIAINHKDVIINRAVALPGFVAEWNKNPFAEVKMIFKNAINGKLYIPGSSIKGAFRTAMLENIRKQEKMEPYSSRDERKNDTVYESSGNFETKILKKLMQNSQGYIPIIHDPFKFLKLSDFQVDAKKVLFGTVRIKDKLSGLDDYRDSRRAGIPIYSAMTDAEIFSDNSAGKMVTATGFLSIAEEGFNNYCRLFGFRNDFFSNTNMLSSLNDFYDLIVANDKHKLTKDVGAIIDDSKGDNKAVLRLGRFAQIESKTFNIERLDQGTVKHPVKKDMNKKGGISRAFINDSIPLGWCAVRISEN